MLIGTGIKSAVMESDLFDWRLLSIMIDSPSLLRGQTLKCQRKYFSERDYLIGEIVTLSYKIRHVIYIF